MFLKMSSSCCKKQGKSSSTMGNQGIQMKVEIYDWVGWERNSYCSGLRMSLILETTEGNAYAKVADIFGFTTGKDKNWFYIGRNCTSSWKRDVYKPTLEPRKDTRQHVHLHLNHKGGKSSKNL